jgi:sulfur transfer complex TusBCD TusB component (DsrH family)
MRLASAIEVFVLQIDNQARGLRVWFDEDIQVVKKGNIHTVVSVTDGSFSGVVISHVGS